MWRATEQLRRDLSYAARMASRNRGFTTAAILTLALGTGAATATFSIVDAIVFRPLPYASADRLVKIWGSSAADPLDNMSLADFVDISERSGVFEQVAADDGTGFKVEYRGASHDALGGIVTAGVALDARGPSRAGTRISPRGVPTGTRRRPDPHRRRTGAAGLPRTSAGRGPDAQRRRRGASPILGVLPPNVLRYGADFLKPLVTASYPAGREHRDLDVFARLRPGVTLAAAQAELDVLGRQIEAAFPSTNVNQRFRVIPLDKYYAVGRPVRQPRADADARCGGAGAADRVRQCGEPAARPRRGANAGMRHPRRAWRQPGPAGAAAADREHAAVPRRRRAWLLRRVVGARLAWWRSPWRAATFPSGWWSRSTAGCSRSACSSRSPRARVRARAGLAGVAGRFEQRPEGFAADGAWRTARRPHAGGR